MKKKRFFKVRKINMLGNFSQASYYKSIWEKTFPLTQNMPKDMI